MKALDDETPVATGDVTLYRERGCQFTIWREVARDKFGIELRCVQSMTGDLIGRELNLTWKEFKDRGFEEVVDA